MEEFISNIKLISYEEYKSFYTNAYDEEIVRVITTVSDEYCHPFSKPITQTREVVEIKEVIETHEVTETKEVITEKEVVTNVEVIQIDKSIESWYSDLTVEAKATYINDLTKENSEVLVKLMNDESINYYYGYKRINSDDHIYQYDGQNSVVSLMDSENKLLETYNYSDFGQRNIEYNGFLGHNEYGYKAQVLTLGGLQYLQTRYYDASSTVFIQQDTYRGDLSDPITQNRYLYGNNNPNKYFDPSGKWGSLKKAFNNMKKSVKNVVNSVKKPAKKKKKTIKKASKPTRKIGGSSVSSVSKIANISTNAIKNVSTSVSKKVVYEEPKISYVNSSGQVIRAGAAQIKKEANDKKSSLNNSLGTISSKTMGIIKPISLGINVPLKKSIEDAQALNVQGSLSNKLKGYCDSAVEVIVDGINSVVDYLGKSLNQLILGEYTEDVTLLGTGAQIGAAFYGLDLPMDFRSLFHNFTNWKWSWEHVGTTTLNLVAIIPGVGMIKSVDELVLLAKSADKVDVVVDVVKNTDDIVDVVKQSDDVAEGMSVANKIENGVQVNADDIVFSDKFSGKNYTNQVTERGWNNELIANTINNPTQTKKSINKATGNTSTHYYLNDTHYVAVDDVTGKVIQIADLTKPWDTN